ncbi:NAD-dependent epimerase/dehydratase family protein [Deinococcus aquiradiocola]|nr:NAD-dependent epimerase/dehydratase family protein [Deinococcus aquiradiocola]
MRVLVTGATGFLGGAAARHLLASGHDVRGTGRNDRAGAALQRDGVPFVPADLTDPAVLPDLLRGMDAVLHCAALSTLWAPWAEYRRHNVQVSADLAAACARQGVRLVHVSTPSVYNAARVTRQVPESTPIPERYDSRYARSKHLAEHEVRLHLPDATILRPRGLYGPGDPSILPRLARALRARRLPRLGHAEVWTELTHVQNAAHAARLALEHRTGGVFNVTDGESVPIWQTVDRLADALGVPRPTRVVPARVAERAAQAAELIARLRPGQPEPPVTASGVRLLTRGMTLDLTRARTLLGYDPPVRPREGVPEAIDAAREACT